MASWIRIHNTAADYLKYRSAELACSVRPLRLSSPTWICFLAWWACPASSRAARSDQRPHSCTWWSQCLMKRQVEQKVSGVIAKRNFTHETEITLGCLEDLFSLQTAKKNLCWSRIPDPNFPSRIQGKKDSGSRIRILKEFNIFN